MQSKGNLFKDKSIPEIQLMILKDMGLYFGQKLYSKIPASFFSVYSPFGPEDPDRKRFSKIFGQMVKNKDDFNPSQLNLSPK